MAGVNGIEIKVGQVWRCRDGVEREIDNVGKGAVATSRFDVGCFHNEMVDHEDLIELVKDENGFTIWRGGEQPVSDDTMVTTRFNDGSGSTTRAGSCHWGDTNLVAYKVVEQAATQQPADSATLAEETLSALGWTFDGQAWVEQPKAELPIGMVPNALDVQVGGTHYKDMGVQPWVAFDSWLSPEQHVGYLLGTAIAYLARFNSKGVGKGGLVDVEKATHTLQRLVEVAKKGSANED